MNTAKILAVLGFSLSIPICCHAQTASRQPIDVFIHQEVSRELVQPFNLMPDRLTNVLGEQAACGGGHISVRENEVRVTLDIGYSDHSIWNPNSQSNDKVHLRTYNGCLTGPTLTIHPGDTLLMNLHNNLPANIPTGCPEPLNTPNCLNSGNLHTHGLHVSPAGNSDNVLISVDPQTTFPYRYDIPSTHPSGTFWYHSHRHGSTALSVTSGMEGVLIVKGNRTYKDRIQNDGVVDIDTILHSDNGRQIPERTMLFQQIAYGCFSDPEFKKLDQDAETGQWLCPSGSTGVVENYKLQFGFTAPINHPTQVQDVWPLSQRYTEINGKVQPILHATTGMIERWRLIHGGVRDTINLQVVKATGQISMASTAAAGSAISASAQPQMLNLNATTTPDLDALERNLQTLRSPQLQAFVNQSCGGGDSVKDVDQYEFAQDGLTRHQITAKSLNILNPGQRSDALIAFKEAGIYCLLDQAGSDANTIVRQGGRLGSKSRQLLGIIVVTGGSSISGVADAFVKKALVTANPDLPQAVRDRINAFNISDFAYFPPSRPPGGDLATAAITGHPSSEFVILGLPLAQGATLPPDQPAPNTDIAAIVGMVKNTAVQVNGSDVLSYNHNVSYQAVLGSVDEWTLGAVSAGPGTIAAPHVFHIHVNPFQVMDITDTSANNQSIFGTNGTCKPIYLQPTIPGPNNTTVANPQYSPEYCDEYHVFRDTLFVKPNFLVKARSAYDDFIGEYVLHCHILDHEDQGMMQNVTIVSSANQEPVAPLQAAAIHHH